MKSHVFAAIDVGSNAARLLIKRADPLPNGDVSLEKLCFLRYPLGLGEDVFSIGRISKIREEKMMEMLKGFKIFMRLHDVEHYRACATSAMRDAANGNRIVGRIKDKLGIKIRIIDGKEEAAIVYGNHIEKSNREHRTCAYVDVGGGSTEVTLLHEGEIRFSGSFNIGSIRLLHSTPASSQATLDCMYNTLREVAEDWGSVDMIGSGGNISRLYKLSNERGGKIPYLPVDKLRQLHDELALLNVAERMAQFELKRNRAEVIVPAARIFMNAASALGTERIFVPSLGLADGIIDSLWLKKAAKESFGDRMPEATEAIGGI